MEPRLPPFTTVRRSVDAILCDLDGVVTRAANLPARTGKSCSAMVCNGAPPKGLNPPNYSIRSPIPDGMLRASDATRQ
jgi:hypothetical protein